MDARGALESGYNRDKDSEHPQPACQKPKHAGKPTALALVAICTLLSVLNVRWRYNTSVPAFKDVAKDTCPQAAPIIPSLHSDLHSDLEKEYATDDFKLKAYESLGGAVRIP